MTYKDFISSIDTGLQINTGGVHSRKLVLLFLFRLPENYSEENKLLQNKKQKKKKKKIN